MYNKFHNLDILNKDLDFLFLDNIEPDSDSKPGSDIEKDKVFPDPETISMKLSDSNLDKKDEDFLDFLWSASNEKEDFFNYP